MYCDGVILQFIVKNVLFACLSVRDLSCPPNRDRTVDMSAIFIGMPNI